MKAVLEFNLDEREDLENFQRCVKATDMALALHKILRLKLPVKALNDVLEIVEEYNCHPDGLVS